MSIDRFCEVGEASVDTALVTVTSTKHIYITCGAGNIDINLESGAVTLPDGVEFSEAARAFWHAVEIMFPGAVGREEDGGRGRV